MFTFRQIRTLDSSIIGLGRFWQNVEKTASCRSHARSVTRTPVCILVATVPSCRLFNRAVRRLFRPINQFKAAALWPHNENTGMDRSRTALFRIWVSLFDLSLRCCRPIHQPIAEVIGTKTCPRPHQSRTSIRTTDTPYSLIMYMHNRTYTVGTPALNLQDLKMADQKEQRLKKSEDVTHFLHVFFVCVFVSYGPRCLK